VREEERDSDLRKDLLGQTGALEEGDGLGTADTAVSIQIGASKISIEEIDIRCCRCHCRIQQHRLISIYCTLL